MHLSPDEPNQFSLSRFESMLQTNDVYFFDSEEFEGIIHHYLEHGKIALAKKATKLGLAQHPTSMNLKLFEVEMMIFENKLDQAEVLLDQLYILEQSNEEIFIQKANILSRRNQHRQAIILLEQALSISEDQLDVLSLIGMEYLFLEDYENAKTYFMRCVDEDTEDYSALYNVVYCFEFLEQHTEAIVYLNEFLDHNPYCEVAWHQIGKQYYQLKDYQKALAAFDFAIISDDRFIGAYLEKGKVLERLKDYGQAIESYMVTLTLDDPTSFALLRIGKCYEKLGQSDLALQFFNKCVEEDALLDKAWIAITDFYVKKKDFDKALYFIEKAVNIDGDNALYWKRHARISLKLNRYEEAEHAFRRTIELGNYELTTWLSRCDLLIKLGEHRAAINNLLQACEFHPDQAEIEFRLGGLYYLLNDQHKGQFHMINGLHLNHEFVMVIEILFPKVHALLSVQELIQNHQKPSV
ncbi:MAG: tetratricopeptide repeat protein [Flavobacteriaceae bacterium]|jgi:tetratricopeptide (TPR) repeat protein|nr:tetratricopeptide repeat protein [Flavobacteriaceae bacterium]MDG1063617.1 tetratricopeptide repeat protein [Flavobacteriaceae bacterium]